jgi:hypothetical protein
MTVYWKKSVTAVRPRYEYHLTERGRDFRPVIIALAEWGNRHFATEGRQIQLVEKETQRLVHAMMVDAETGHPLTPEKYALVPGPAASP